MYRYDGSCEEGRMSNDEDRTRRVAGAYTQG